MADQNTIERAMSGLGSTIVRAGQLIRRARSDFGHAHEPRQRAFTALAAALIACALTSLLLISWGGPAPIHYIEAPLRNARVLNLEDPAARDPNILVIAIDERALAYGDATDPAELVTGNRGDATREPYAWPWPRHVYNKIIRWCRAGGARVIAFDMIFSESGPNTNEPFTLVPRTGGGFDRIWTGDKAGDDLFILEATAREDVALALGMDSRAREAERRDELVKAYAADIAGADSEAALALVRERLAGLVTMNSPVAGLLDGRPVNAAMKDLSQYKPEEQKQEVAAFYNALARRTAKFESPRFQSLQPLPAARLQGVAGAGHVFVRPDESDGALRQAMMLATHDGKTFRHLALECWRIYVLSFAREGGGKFSETFPGLALSGDKLAWDGAEYALSNSLRDVPVKVEDGRLRYLGIDVPVDDAAAFEVRYRSMLPAELDPVYVTGSEAVRARVRETYERDRPVVLYPTISAADVLRDWDAFDLTHGGWERKREDLRRQIKSKKQDIEDEGEAEGGPLHRELAGLQTRLDDMPATPPGGWPKTRLGDPLNLAKDKVVFIAGSASGLGDQHNTPLARYTPGTFFLANVFDNLKNNDVMKPLPAATTWLLALTAAIIAALAVMYAPKLRWGAAATVLLAAGVFAASIICFNNHVWFPTAAPMAGLMLGLGNGALAKVLTEGRQRRQREAFARQYMGKELVDFVIKNPGSLKLGGENRPMSIYFSDVAGFTTVSETLGPNNPERLVELLNVYLERMTDLMLETGGVIDKYIGDAIMCFWGAPMSMDDHAVRAVRGALACRAELQRMQPLFADAVRGVAPQLIKPDGSVLLARAGINTGIVTVGNMGSSKRFAYTVMGDAVNLASRLEGQNKEYGTDILIGPRTADAVKGEFTMRRIDLIVVKGKTEPVEVFEVMGEREVPDFVRELIAEYERGIDLYRDAQFESALEAFRKSAKLETARGGMTPSGLYMQRCEDLIAHPPQKGWTGTMIKKSK